MSRAKLNSLFISVTGIWVTRGCIGFIFSAEEITACISDAGAELAYEARGEWGQSR